MEKEGTRERRITVSKITTNSAHVIQYIIVTASIKMVVGSTFAFQQEGPWLVYWGLSALSLNVLPMHM